MTICNPNTAYWSRRIAEAFGSTTDTDPLAKPCWTVDRTIDDIWAYVRENSDSLNSDVCTAMIREMVERTTKELQQELAMAEDRRKRANGIIRTLKAALKRLEAKQR